MLTHAETGESKISLGRLSRGTILGVQGWAVLEGSSLAILEWGGAKEREEERKFPGTSPNPGRYSHSSRGVSSAQRACEASPGCFRQRGTPKVTCFFLVELLPVPVLCGADRVHEISLAQNSGVAWKLFLKTTYTNQARLHLFSKSTLRMSRTSLLHTPPPPLLSC